MKRLLFLAGCMAYGMYAGAQTPFAGNGDHVKLDDVIALYKQQHPEYGKRDYTKVYLPGIKLESSEKDRFFDHWLWYWRQHTDESGYLVSPAKTWEEWRKANPEHSGAKTTTGASWTFVGPDSSEANGMGVGRVNTIAFHPTDVNTYWVGTPGGGAWKTTNNGNSWTCMTDQIPLLAVSAIAFNPLNPNTVYLCTGDRDASDYSGVGLLKSYDGGLTWHTTAIAWGANQMYTANSMVVNPQDTNTIVVATTQGMYLSRNGGASVSVVAAGDFTQVLYAPADTNVLYAASGGASTPQVWRSGNGGATWTRVTTFTDLLRITLAVTPAAPDMVMAITCVLDAGHSYQNYAGLGGLYKSSDTGNSFHQVYATTETPSGCNGNLLTWAADGNDCNGQGWYTLPLAISPADSNLVYTGGVNTWRSADGGLTWAIANQESPSSVPSAIVHADKHWMAFHALLPGRFFETNDGGVYCSDNPVASGAWRNITNRMGIEEIYRLGISNIASFSISGAQDVGVKIERLGGLTEEAYTDGDGMNCVLDFADSTVAYGSYQYGAIGRMNPTAPTPFLTAVDVAANIPGSVEGTGNWVTPFVLEPSCHKCLLAGYSALYRSKDEGNTWNMMSAPSLSSNTYYRIAVSQTDSNAIYLSEDNLSRDITYTRDGGGSWQTVTSSYSGFPITDLAIDPANSDHIWITYGGYGSAQVVQWSSATGFQLMKSGLPNVPVYCVAFDYLSRDIYVGTEIGVYYRDSSMTSWAPYTTGMPAVKVTDIGINYATNELWASTFGRSVWRTAKHTATVLPNSIMSIAPVAADAMVVSPNPSNGSFAATLKVAPATEVTMTLADEAGRTVWTGKSVVSGNKVEVKTNGLANGTYLLEVRSGTTTLGKQKVVIY